VPNNYVPIDVPTPAGQLGFTSLGDINDKGEILGGFTAGPHGFLLDKRFRLKGTVQCLGATETQPQATNRYGEICGFCTANKVRGFYRNKQHQYVFLDFPGATITDAIGINNYGHVVGDYRDSVGRFHGFFWSYGLFLTVDVPFSGAADTSPTAINNIGHIVGFYDDLSGGRHGFIYDNATFTSFDFPGAQMTDPADTNDQGQIVGSYTDSSGVLHGFLRQGGTFSGIDVPFSGVTATEVSGINDRGEIVGRYLDSNSTSHGFLAK